MPLSVSAVNVPSSLIGFRTLFSSFHHFSPDQARSILADAVSKRQGIAIAESTQRHVLTLSYMLVTPVLVWMATPFYRNFSWRRVFWTYCLPIIPLVVLFDGLVSCMRTYTPDELQGLVAGIPENDAFDWDIGLIRIGILPVGVTYLIGVPKSL